MQKTRAESLCSLTPVPIGCFLARDTTRGPWHSRETFRTEESLEVRLLPFRLSALIDRSRAGPEYSYLCEAANASPAVCREVRRRLGDGGASVTTLLQKW
jgi:hypothetical protein